MQQVKINDIVIGGNNPIVLLAGPCVVENEKITLYTAEKIKEICHRLKVDFIFKASYKKANRTSVESFTGLDRYEALRILEKVKEEFEVPVVTDIHTAPEASEAAAVVDVLQIPAFLCRQTDLLTAAGDTGKVVNIKKGQFLAPSAMAHAAGKVRSTGNNNIMLTERGTTFGYNDLIVDMRSFLIMKETGYPVVMDATHSVQMPGKGDVTGGNPSYIGPLARAAAATGIDALFMEVHPDPANALSDAASQLPLDIFEETIKPVLEIDRLVKNL